MGTYPAIELGRPGPTSRPAWKERPLRRAITAILGCQPPAGSPQQHRVRGRTARSRRSTSTATSTERWARPPTSATPARPNPATTRSTSSSAPSPTSRRCQARRPGLQRRPLDGLRGELRRGRDARTRSPPTAEPVAAVNEPVTYPRRGRREDVRVPGNPVAGQRPPQLDPLPLPSTAGESSLAGRFRCK